MAAQTVTSVTLPAVSITRRYDYDYAGRLISERHLDINGVTKPLGYGYWPNGAVKKKYLADNSSTRQYVYDALQRPTAGTNQETGTRQLHVEYARRSDGLQGPVQYRHQSSVTNEMIA